MIILYVTLAVVILFLLLRFFSAVIDVFLEILNFFICIAMHIYKICAWIEKQVKKTRTSPAENNKADAEPEEYLYFIVCK